MTAGIGIDPRRLAFDILDRVAGGGYADRTLDATLQRYPQLDPRDLRLGQEAARAALEAAQVNLDLTAADFKRFRDLRNQGFISAFIVRTASSMPVKRARLMMLWPMFSSCRCGMVRTSVVLT